MGRKATTRERKAPGPSVQRWLSALFSYWQEHGMANQTMDDWAVAVEKSKATLYAYFKSKEEMVEAALAVKLQNIQAFEGPLLDSSRSYVDRYRDAFELISPQLGEISVVFLSDLRTEFPKQMEMIDTFLNYVGEVLGRFYQEGFQAGAFREANVPMLVLMDQQFFQQLTDPKFLQSAGITLKEAVTYFIELKFQGLLRH